MTCSKSYFAEQRVVVGVWKYRATGFLSRTGLLRRNDASGYRSRSRGPEIIEHKNCKRKCTLLAHSKLPTFIYRKHKTIVRLYTVTLFRILHNPNERDESSFFSKTRKKNTHCYCFHTDAHLTQRECGGGRGKPIVFSFRNFTPLCTAAAATAAAAELCQTLCVFPTAFESEPHC